MDQSISRMLNPKSIAVIGANEKGSYGGRMMRNLMAKKYQGKIYPVNPGHDSVYGYQCYPSIGECPAQVDLAIIIVKAEFVEDIVRQCSECGVGGCLIITAGFRELDPINGPERERKIKKIADATKMRLIGPNCLGIANTELSMWACSLTTLPQNDIEPGKAALISQSGAAGFGPLLNMALDRNLGLRYICTTGNETDITMCDFLEYMLDDERIHAIGLLIEGLKEVERFKKLAERALQLGKRIAALKLGESEVGSRAAASHTASMTGNMELFNALTRQYGIIKAEDYDELIELMNILQQDRQPQGKRLAVFAHSGGISGLLGDLLCKHGFEIPVTSQKTQDEINVFLKGFGSPRNPMDMSTYMRRPCIVDIVNSIETNDHMDGYVFATNGDAEAMNNVNKAGLCTGKPYYYIWTGRLNDEDGLNFIRSTHMPISFGIQRFAGMLEKVYKAKKEPDEIPGAQTLLLKDQKAGFLNEAEAKGLLDAVHVPSPSRYVLPLNPELKDMKQICFDEKQYVAKIISAEILHKSDMGGVVLGIKNEEELQHAVETITEAGRRSGKNCEGILVEEMCHDGLDMVLGIRKDDFYGPVVMIGLGGIYTELFKMISIRLIPVSREEIRRMMEEIPGFMKMAAGYRGQMKLDIDALVETVSQICNFVHANQDSVKLLEINPLRVMKHGVCALDCVVELDAKEAAK